MASDPGPLAAITAEDYLLALFARSGNRDEVRREGERLRERRRQRVADADSRRYLHRAGPPGPPFEGTADQPGTDSNPLTEQQAQELFEELAALEHIPFDYPVDGCFARAHEMARHIQDKGMACAKVWNYPVTNKLVVPGTEFGNIQWQYHVAVVVCVTGADGNVREMVIDPSLAREDPRPLTQEEWVAMQGGPDGQSQRVTSAEPYVYKLAHPENAYERGTITMDPRYQNTEATLEYMSIQRDLVRVWRQLTLPEDAPTLDTLSARPRR